MSREFAVYDALVISDIHLGSDNCQARELGHFLNAIRSGELQTRQLILNGDVFDSFDFRRLNKHHWKILSRLRKLSDQIEIVWINGNHDGPNEIVSHLLGLEVRESHIIDSGDQRILFLHGHQFDQFIARYPVTTWVADWCYRLLQKLDKSHTIARKAKHNSKVFLRCADAIKIGAAELAAKTGCDAVCCGHTHLPVEGELTDGVESVRYYNSGCWTERPCYYLAIADGEVQLRTYAEPETLEESDWELQEEPATAVKAELLPVG